jgi:hypothetical protein
MKRIILILVTILILSLSFSGCWHIDESGPYKVKVMEKTDGI